MTIIRQQAKLELGDNYDHALLLCKVRLTKLYERYGFERIRDGEGGYSSILDTMLAFIVQSGDVESGLREYGNYIAAEYRLDTPHNQTVGLDELDAQTAQLPNVSLPQHYLDALGSDNQRDIAVMLYEQGLKQCDVAELLGVSEAAVSKVAKKIRKRMSELEGDYA